MTYDEVIKYLKSYQELKYNIEFYRNKMGGLKAMSYSQEEKGATQDNMMSVYMQKIDDAEKGMKEIENFIEDNFTGKSRICIWNRFVNADTYRQIGAEINYTSSYTKKFINKCIEEYVKHSTKDKKEIIILSRV